MYINLFFAVVLIGPLIYILATLSGQKSTSFEDYYIANRSIKPDKFISSTVIYSLQVAAITLFSTWGFLYGFWVVLVPIFWAAGYLLIIFLIKKGYLDSFLFSDSTGTIHQFIGNHSNARSIAIIAALCSLVGISGPALFEAEFVGGLISNLVASNNSEVPSNLIIEKYSNLFFVALVGFACTYMLYGGFRALIKTDEIQLSIGFISFSIFLSLIFYLIAINGHLDASLVLGVLAAILCFSVVAIYLKEIKNKVKIISAFPVLVSLIAFSCSVVFSYIYGFNIENNNNKLIQVLKIDEPLILGGMSLISLLVANVLYQLVDIGQWQRLLSIKLYKKDSKEQCKSIISSSLAKTGLYCSITWILAILLGVSLNFISADIAANPYDAIKILLIDMQSNQGVLGKVITLTFMLSIVAIAMSTMDSLISSITFTIHNDWLLSISDKLKSQTVARLSTVIYVVIAISAYKWLYSKVDNFADILYCCWGFQIALAPTITGALLGHAGNKIRSISSILFGAIGALTPLFIAEMDPYQYSPFLALLFSSAVYIVFSLGIKLTTVPREEKCQ